jgi:2,4-dienoyl-CoA reductase (NADPH2)
MDVLFQPVCIGSLELKNRLVMPAMHLGYCDNGLVTGRLVDFYRERALGGVGLIVVGGCAIDDHGYNTMIKISSDDYITGLTGLVEVVHSGGAAIAAQLFQPGRYSYSFNSGIQPVAPSAVPSKLTGQMPRELGLNEIYQIIDSFAAAAGRAKQAGFDAVEVIGSAGYLVAQFLSPVTNQRDDEFGGDFQRRMRFGLEVAARIKQVCGQDFPLMFRITGNEFMPGGNTNDEMAVFCRELEQAGVDAINVTGGWHETRVPQITMGVPRGGFAYLARGIKEAVDIPVMACNRINDPWLAA